MGQEARHLKQLRRFNDAPITKDDPELSEGERQMEREHQELR